MEYFGCFLYTRRYERRRYGSKMVLNLKNWPVKKKLFLPEVRLSLTSSRLLATF